MRFIKPSYEILSCPEGEEVLRLLELAARNCYKSEDKIDYGERCDCGGSTNWSAGCWCTKCKGTNWAREPSSHKLIRKVLKMGHESVIEHATIVVRFIVNRGVTHELVRHRLASYSQECLAGDTEVRKGRTIKELFDRSSTSYGKTHNKTLYLRSCDGHGNIVPNKMVAVTHKGVGIVYRLTTKLGYAVKATADHRFLQPDGSWVELRYLQEGHSLMVNGRPSLLRIPDEELKEHYLVDGLSPQEIADEYEAPYRSVLRRLKWLRIFKKRLNDKNPEKYQRGYSAESVDKMRRTILQQYMDGREPWNKGLSEENSEAVSRQADALRAHHHDNQPGSANSNWQGGVSISYYQSLVPDGPCELCQEPDAPEIHHIDGDRCHNIRENLVRICVNCHDKLHHGWHVGRRAHPDEITRIEQLGEEDVYDIEMVPPFHNFVANGIVVSNSTRYCNYSKERHGSGLNIIEPIYRPDLDSAIGQQEVRRMVWENTLKEVERAYFKLIELGERPQEARDILPIGLKTEIVTTANLREWRHIFKLRAINERAHPQIREVMLPLLAEVKQRIPILFDDIVEQS